MNKKYAYTPSDHLKRKLHLQQQSIPQSVLATIKSILIEKNIYDPSSRDIKHILIETENIQYIENVNKILSLINNPTIYIREECIICFETVDKMVKLRCNHSFCESCMNSISMNNKISCPLCRNIQQFNKQHVSIDKDRMEQILVYFRAHKNDYIKPGYFVSFDDIINDINKKIEVNDNFVS